MDALNGLYALDVSTALDPQPHRRSWEQIKESIKEVERETKLLGSGKRIPPRDMEQFPPINSSKEDILSVFRTLKLAGANIHLKIISRKLLEEEELQFLRKLSQVTNLDLELVIRRGVGSIKAPNHKEHSYITTDPRISHSLKEKTSYWKNKNKILDALALSDRYLSLLQNIDNNKTYNQLMNELGHSRSTIVSYSSKLEEHDLIEKKKITDSGSEKILLSPTTLGENILILLGKEKDSSIKKQLSLSKTPLLRIRLWRHIRLYLFNPKPPPPKPMLAGCRGR